MEKVFSDLSHKTGRNLFGSSRQPRINSSVVTSGVLNSVIDAEDLDSYLLSEAGLKMTDFTVRYIELLLIINGILILV